MFYMLTYLNIWWCIWMVWVASPSAHVNQSLLFRAGAHWPLLVPLGKKSRRSPEAIQRREQRAKQRAANARSAKGHLGLQQANRDGQRIRSAQGREAWEDWGHREDWRHWWAWGGWGQPSWTWQSSWGSGQWHQDAWQWYSRLRRDAGAEAFLRDGGVARESA